MKVDILKAGIITVAVGIATGCSSPAPTPNIVKVYGKSKGGVGKTFSKSDLMEIVGSYDQKTLAQDVFKTNYSGGQFSGRGKFKGIRTIKLFLVSPVADAIVDGVTISCILKKNSAKAKRIAGLKQGQTVTVSGRLDGVGKNSLQIGEDNCDYTPAS